MSVLAPHHRAELEIGSAINAEIIDQRGYATIEHPDDLPHSFADYQRRPGLLIPIRDTTGRIATWQLKAVVPRTGKDGKPIKYDTAVSGQQCLDVPPRCRPLLGNPGIPLWITEGAKKVDSALSHGIPCIIGVQGVYGWRGRNQAGGLTALADWEDIALNGREVVLAFDSDVMAKASVRSGLERLSSLLQKRKAVVRYLLLPPVIDKGALQGETPSKVGLDDFFASGATLADLERLIVDRLPALPHPSAPFDTKPAMNPTASYGLAGDVMRAVEPTTEADPAAVLLSFLTMFGNAVGRQPHILIGDTRHGPNLFTVLVGETSRARKGSSQHGPMRLMSYADPEWAENRVQGGLSTGEGLIAAVRDAVVREDADEGTKIVDAGVSDKRLLCIEEEFSQVLKTAQRQGNTITEIMRRAWDANRPIQTLTKHSPSKATDAHISILGHITKAELHRNITETELANGLANRILWIRVDRSKLLPNPQPLASDVVTALGARIANALEFAQTVDTVTLDAEAEELWAVAYEELERDRPGLAGAITGRASPIVKRLSLVYALLDRSRVIRPEHLEAALAVWDYAEASITSIFGDLTGDAFADRIYQILLREGPMSRNDIRDQFSRNPSAARLEQALEILLQTGKIISWTERPEGGEGRNRTVYDVAPDTSAA